jgi:hypothetical protein
MTAWAGMVARPGRGCAGVVARPRRRRADMTACASMTARAGVVGRLWKRFAGTSVRADRHGSAAVG